jgi:hypothetical protein
MASTRSARAVQFIATGSGAAVLIVVVTAVTWLLSPAESVKQTALVANAFAGLVAVAAWSGVLFRGKGGGQIGQPENWTDWVGIFFVASVMSALFLFIDCGHHLPPVLGGRECDGHPGITIALTCGALAMAAIALPSAIRAWLISALAPAAEDERAA